jgi:hypothetical protein
MVAQHVTHQLPEKTYNDVIVYAHPEHSERCYMNASPVFRIEDRNTAEENARHRKAELEDLWINERRWELWDAESAQVWTRSSKNWQTYNDIR